MQQINTYTQVGDQKSSWQEPINYGDKAAIFKRATVDRRTISAVSRDESKALAAYYGGETLFAWISPFSKREDKEKQIWRSQRTLDHFNNYPREIIGAYLDGIYRKNAVKRTSGIDALDNYLNVDYDTKFKNDIAVMQLLIPETFIYLCHANSELDNIVITEQDKIDNNLWAKPIVIKGSQVVNYELDEYENELEWVSRRIVRNDWLGDVVRNTEKIELIDEFNIYILALDGTIESVEPHGFVKKDVNGKIVPTVPVIYKPYRFNYSVLNNENTKRGLSYMYQVVNKSIACLQIMAMLVETSYFNLHYQMYMDKKTFDDVVKTGMGNGLPIVIDTEDTKPGESRITPGYIQPPSVQLDKLIELAYDKIPQDIYRAAKIKDRTGAVYQSGIAKIIDAVPELAAIANIADYLRNIDYDIVNIISTTFDNNSEVEVFYPLSFDFTTSTDNLAQLLSLSQGMQAAGIKSPTLIAELAKQTATSLLPDICQEKMDMIFDEIDANAQRELASLNIQETPEEQEEDIQDIGLKEDEGTMSDKEMQTQMMKMMKNKKMDMSEEKGDSDYSNTTDSENLQQPTTK